MILDKFRPLKNNLLVKFTETAERTWGGIYLPNSMRYNWTECEVLASGCKDGWIVEGDIIVTQKYGFIPLIKSEGIGITKDTDILGYINDNDEFFPLNEWVAIEPDPWECESERGIIIPEEYRHRPHSGIIRYCGPGRIVKGGPNAGQRQSVYDIMGVGSVSDLRGKRVYWSEQATALEIGQEYVSLVLVPAWDLDLIGDIDG